MGYFNSLPILDIRYGDRRIVAGYMGTQRIWPSAIEVPYNLENIVFLLSQCYITAAAKAALNKWYSKIEIQQKVQAQLLQKQSLSSNIDIQTDNYLLSKISLKHRIQSNHLLTLKQNVIGQASIANSSKAFNKYLIETQVAGVAAQSAILRFIKNNKIKLLHHTQVQSSDKLANQHLSHLTNKYCSDTILALPILQQNNKLAVSVSALNASNVANPNTYGEYQKQNLDYHISIIPYRIIRQIPQQPLLQLCQYDKIKLSKWHIINSLVNRDIHTFGKLLSANSKRYKIPSNVIMPDGIIQSSVATTQLQQHDDTLQFTEKLHTVIAEPILNGALHDLSTDWVVIPREGIIANAVLDEWLNHLNISCIASPTEYEKYFINLGPLQVNQLQANISYNKNSQIILNNACSNFATSVCIAPIEHFVITPVCINDNITVGIVQSTPSQIQEQLTLKPYLQLQLNVDDELSVNFINKLISCVSLVYRDPHKLKSAEPYILSTSIGLIYRDPIKQRTTDRAVFQHSCTLTFINWEAPYQIDDALFIRQVYEANDEIEANILYIY